MQKWIRNLLSCQVANSNSTKVNIEPGKSFERSLLYVFSKLFPLIIERSDVTIKNFVHSNNLFKKSLESCLYLSPKVHINITIHFHFKFKFRLLIFKFVGMMGNLIFIIITSCHTDTLHDNIVLIGKYYDLNLQFYEIDEL